MVVVGLSVRCCWLVNWLLLLLLLACQFVVVVGVVFGVVGVAVIVDLSALLSQSSLMSCSKRTFTVLQGNFQAFLERLDAEEKEDLPGLFFGPQFLPHFDQTLVEINADAGQDFLLSDVDGLRVSFAPIAAGKFRFRSE